MKKRNLSQLLAGLLLLSVIGSCEKREDKSLLFEVQNLTNTEITNVRVVALTASLPQKTLIEKKGLAAGDGYKQSIPPRFLPNSDGSYELQLTEATGSRSYKFGYFTNGVALDKQFIFQVEKDSVLIFNIRREY